ncbi:mechanosensitive ion channel-like protein [Halohasta litchfieldiae]|jgi:small-conductance mechanosensitive channel|uniref:Mechanosensitive ion channel n=1 Tax=Halohasta litchfieldiae TaxID=1073996 RepID=A0A1H6SSC8_9EURY|nr:mechanosensitive ion channel domain-containing protein [Halohasta litchfieldiae]ATW89930.1 mechanosensitive ion channel-like protein [Halohasta litchfieldiae]SEI66502.1 Mechanosensitive ion channel [Halohasta litchfieldiae]
MLQLPSNIAERVVSEFLTDILSILPTLISGLVFLTLAYILIRVIRSVLRSTLGRLYSQEEQLIVDLVVTVVTVFLWFGAGLTLFKIVGMDDVAASLGTATGFVALGIAFALKEMIADTVAGVYLLQDADFNEGDLVTTASVTGTVTGIDLRKTRIRSEEGDLIVVANRDVEKKWVQEAPTDDEVSSTDSGLK